MTFNKSDKIRKLADALEKAKDMEGYSTYNVVMPNERFYINFDPNRYADKVGNCQFIHEVLNENNTYMYCDFDIPYKQDGTEYSDDMVIIDESEEYEAVESLYIAFEYIWKDAQQYGAKEFNRDKCYFLKSEGNYKCSYHFIYQEVMNKESQKEFWRKVNTLIPDKFSGIDFNVDNKNHTMRAVLSNKVGKDNLSKNNSLRPWDFDKNDYIDNYKTVNYLINSDMRTKPHIISNYPKSINEQSDYTTDSLTQYNIDYAVDFFRTFSPNAECADTKNNIINFPNYYECPIHQHVHSSNRPFITYFKKDNRYVIGCRGSGEARTDGVKLFKTDIQVEDVERYVDAGCFDESDDEDSDLIIDLTESKSDVDISAVEAKEEDDEDEEYIDNNIFDNTGSKYRVFDDYEKLKKNNTLSEVKKFVQSTICIITEGGKSSYITRNATLRSARYTFEKVEKSDIYKTLNVNCFIKNPKFNKEAPVNKHNRKYLFTKLGEIVKHFDQNKEIKKYYGQIFEPYLHKDKELDKYLNLFEGFSLQKANPSLGKDFELSAFLAHIKQQICSNDEITYNYLLNWISHLIQHPNENPQSSILLYSLPGGGKDLLCKFIAKMIDSQHHLVVDNAGTLLQQFNEFLLQKLFITLNEMGSGGLDKKLHEQFKSRVTQEHIQIEIKRGKTFDIVNMQRMIMNTNNKDALYIEPGERRTLMVEMSNEKCNDVKHFAPLWKEMGDKSFLIGAFNYFANRDITKFNPRQVPKTKYHQNQSVACLNNVITFTKELISGEYELSYPKYCSTIDDGMKISVTDMYEQYKLWCTSAGERSYKRKTFKSQLFKLKIEDKVLKHTNNKTYRGYNLTLEHIQTEMGNLLSNKEFKIEKIVIEPITKPKMKKNISESALENLTDTGASE